MQRFISHTKAFLLCLSAACSLQANAQYLAGRYDAAAEPQPARKWATGEEHYG